MERREVLREEIKIICRDLNLERTPGLELNSIAECRQEIKNLIKAYYKKQLRSITEHQEEKILLVEIKPEKKSFLKRLFGL